MRAKDERGVQIWIRPPVADWITQYAADEEVSPGGAIERLLRDTLKELGYPRRIDEEQVVELREPVETGNGR